MKVLLDEMLPAGVARLLPDDEMTTVQQVGFKGPTNGALRAAGDCDQGLDRLNDPEHPCACGLIRQPRRVAARDLRLEIGGRVAQIDHLIIDRFLTIWVCESKHFTEGVAVNDHGEWSRFWRGRSTGMPSHTEQNRKHIEVLRDVFDGGLVALPRRLGIAVKPDWSWCRPVPASRDHDRRRPPPRRTRERARLTLTERQRLRSQVPQPEAWKPLSEDRTVTMVLASNTLSLAMIELSVPPKPDSRSQ